MLTRKQIEAEVPEVHPRSIHNWGQRMRGTYLVEKQGDDQFAPCLYHPDFITLMRARAGRGKAPGAPEPVIIERTIALWCRGITDTAEIAQRLGVDVEQIEWIGLGKE